MWAFLSITTRTLRSRLSCFEAVWGHLRLVHVSGHLINRLTQIHLQYTCIDHKNKVTLQFWTKNILETVFSIPTPLSWGSFFTFLHIYKGGSHKTRVEQPQFEWRYFWDNEKKLRVFLIFWKKTKGILKNQWWIFFVWWTNLKGIFCICQGFPNMGW